MDRKEVLKKSIEYFGGDELSANVWINKYALKDSEGNLFESDPNDMHKRLSKEIARIEKKYINPLSEEEIFDLLKDFKYIIPQGGPMSGIGNDKQVSSLSNCFVIGNEYDSYGSIMLTDQEQVQLMKRRGGVGHDLSHLRPSGTPVNNSALTSTGVVSFMNRYSNSTREVGQDGRRGALMLSCDIKNIDAEAFMDAKLDTNKITGANVSLKISDEFMESVINNKPFIQQYPLNSDNPSMINEIDSNKLFKKIVHNAWKSAEPGVLWWDTIIRESVPDCYSEFGYKTTSTNPCGEIPLCPYDSCRLLVLNLYSYVVDPYTKNSYFDFDLFKKHCFYAQRLMDDIIDLEIEKIDKILEKIDTDNEPDYIKMYERNLWEKIKEKTIEGRRSGIGVTAEADMLAALNLRYGTKEATDFSENIHKNMAINIYKSSCLLGQERGNFKIFDYNLEKDNPFIKRLSEADEELKELLKKGRRNISLLTIAPAGTTSMMTQTTSGIEPAFMVAYKRRRKINPNDKDARVDYVDEVGDSWEEYTVLHHGFKRWLLVNNYNVDDIMKYDQEKLDELIKLSPYYKATTDSVDWLEKVRMQGRVQKWVDHSISVTVNLPENTSEETVYNVYMESWKSGCKGVTVYREGSRSGVLISNKKEKEVSDMLNERHAPKRPKMVKCSILRFQNNKEKWVGFVGLIEDRPYEIFTGKLESFPIPNFVEHGHIKKVKEFKIDDDGNNVKVSRYDFVYTDKDGYEQEIRGLSRAFNEEFWNYAKLISGILRHGMPIYNVINLIDSLSFRGDSIVSWKAGVKRMLSKYVKDTDFKGQKCPECGNESLRFESGCVSCQCGWSQCG